MNTIKTKNLPSRTLVEVVGNDANGNTGKMPIGAGVGSTLLGKLIGLNLNTTSDNIITLVGGTKFIITDIIITNASVNINTANDGEFWTGTNRTGISVFRTGDGIVDTNWLANLANSSRYISVSSLTINFNAFQAPQTQGNKLYYSLGTAQGVAATCDCYVFGLILE